MFTIFGITITLAQILAVIPQVIEAVKVADGIYKTLSAAGNDTAVQQSMTVLGKALSQLFSDAAGMGIVPHPMTPNEEKLWMDHQNPTGW